MNRKRVLLVGIVVAGFLGLAAAYALWPEPGYYRAAFDAVSIGMPEDVAIRLIPPHAEATWLSLC
jgi:hypothetical protein